MTGLIARVTELAASARTAYQGSPAQEAVLEVEQRLREPLRVAIAGKVKAGKSTVLNALVGEPLAPTGTAECTKVVTWYVEGQRYRAVLEPVDGRPFEVPVHRSAFGIAPELGGRRPEEIDRLVVEWPSSRLRTMTLIDTPGVGSLSGLGQRTYSLLAPDDATPTAADAILYLTPHLHASDVRFLEAFHDDSNAPATPVNALGVLSRADEIGGARADSMRAAARIADRYRHDPSVRGLCQTIVPVAGLLAQASTSLTEADLRAFARIASLPADEAEALLLTADRFATSPLDDPELGSDRRFDLIDRYGIFGIRLASDLVRHGQADTAARLASELRARSGIDELQRLLATRFSARRDVLKARSGLLALGDVIRRWPLSGEWGVYLRTEVERVHAGAHELAEVRVLTAALSGEVPVDDAGIEELARLLSSGDVRDRLGVEDEADVVDAIVDGVGRWRARAEHPLASPELIEASTVVVRALEGMLAAATTSPS